MIKVIKVLTSPVFHCWVPSAHSFPQNASMVALAAKIAPTVATLVAESGVDVGVEPPEPPVVAVFGLQDSSS